MDSTTKLMRIGVAALTAVVCATAAAALPPPTPEQKQAAQAKKEKDAADAEKQKQELTTSIDKVVAYWRTQAKTNGWDTHPPVPVAAAQGSQTPASQPSAAQQLPIRSEKLGTAPPSEDVKKKPSDDSAGKK